VPQHRALRRTKVDSPLTMNQVYAQVATHAATRPLTTAEIAEYCQDAHPEHPGITTRRVHRHLESLQRRSRVRSWPSTDHAALDAYGIDEPVNRARYWALSDIQETR
jgi:hypothetical protein